MTPKLNRLLLEINSLKARVIAAQEEFLVSLHSELGFESVEALIEALRASTAKSSKAHKVVASATVAPKKKKGTRSKITKEIRDEVVALVGKGEAGSSIAAKLGISLPSVQNIKKAAGLVGKKKADVKAPKKKVPKAPMKEKAVKPKKAPKKVIKAPAAPAAPAATVAAPVAKP